jgi:hypothetical protein
MVERESDSLLFGAFGREASELEIANVQDAGVIA